MREIYGHNFQWQHKRSVSANDRMRMNYQFRLGLSALWPMSNFQPQN